MKVRFSVVLLIAVMLVITVSVAYNANQQSNFQEKVSASVEAAESGKVTILVPAVDSEGKGTLGKFEVQAMPGNGKILTNIEHLLFFVDTQFSMQTAKAVAANVTGADLSKYNLIYDIDASGDLNSTRIVEGPSAGAALTIATIAAIENKTLDPSVMITGTIMPDGTIGKIGGVPQKAKAAREGGAKVFLVPKGQGVVQEFKPEIKCENVGRIRVCRTEYKPQESVKTVENGLIVREVSDIREALKYFLQ